MLLWLKDYIRNTHKDQIKAEWSKVEAIGFNGPNAFEYLQYLNQIHYPHPREYCTYTKIIFPKNMTPNFTESFFLCNIVK